MIARSFAGSLLSYCRVERVAYHRVDTTFGHDERSRAEALEAFRTLLAVPNPDPAISKSLIPHPGHCAPARLHRLHRISQAVASALTVMAAQPAPLPTSKSSRPNRLYSMADLHFGGQVKAGRTGVKGSIKMPQGSRSQSKDLAQGSLPAPAGRLCCRYALHHLDAYADGALRGALPAPAVDPPA